MFANLVCANEIKRTTRSVRHSVRVLAVLSLAQLISYCTGDFPLRNKVGMYLFCHTIKRHRVSARLVSMASVPDMVLPNPNTYCSKIGRFCGLKADARIFRPGRRQQRNNENRIRLFASTLAYCTDTSFLHWVFHFYQIFGRRRRGEWTTTEPVRIAKVISWASFAETGRTSSRSD